MEKILFEVLQYAAPSLVTGGLAYYFFLRLSQSEDKKNMISLLKEDKQLTMPVRLQAYERLTLLMERITPNSLLTRISPTSDNIELYVQKLLQTIEQEFEYNLSQQIYVSEDCWTVIITTKNSLFQLIQSTSKEEGVNSANDLRTLLLTKMIKESSPTTNCISFMKAEVQKIMDNQPIGIKKAQ